MANGRAGARALWIVVGLCAAAAIGFAVGKRERGPALQPGEQLADNSVVLVAVRSLARLESVAYHMERIIDLKQRQDHLFGLLHARTRSCSWPRATSSRGSIWRRCATAT